MRSLNQSTPDPDAPPLPGLADVEAAATRLAGHAVLTPLLEFPVLNDLVRGRVLIKAETLQRTGSFKFRGAYNRIRQIPERRKAKGVVAYSSGNHAQGVAAAAALLDLPATIVMPSDAPTLKIENTRSYGAEIVFYDRYKESRQEIAAALARERSATLVPPYDDPQIIAGQGTCGLEICRQASAVGASIEQVLVSCGGGGLVAGCSLALKALAPDCAIYGVEPEQFDDTRRSLETGHRIENDPSARSICDALLVSTPGALTFEINRRNLAGGLVVADREVRAAMAFAFRHLKLVVEPGGAVTLAALLTGRVATADRTTVVVLSGANVDPVFFAEVITETGRP